jgi:hypothetical protein
MVRVAGDTLRGSTERGVDLLEAVKVACARLRIPYDAELVRLAVDHVERTNRA